VSARSWTRPSRQRARGDRRLLAHVLHWASSAQLGSADSPRTLWELTGELEALAAELGDPVLRWSSAQFRFVAAIQLGEIDEVDRAAAVLSALADELGQPTYQWAATYHECSRQQLRGDVAAAEAAAYKAAAIGHESGQPDAPVIAAGELFAIRAEQARLGELVEILEQRVAENPGLPTLEATLALAYAELDRFDDARLILDRVAADNFASLPCDVGWLNGMSRYADTAARLRATDAAAEVYDRLLPYQDRIVTSIITVSGSAERPLGVLAATLGRWGAAEDHFARAQEIHERIGARLSSARTWMNHGRALLMRGEHADRERAAELLRRAVALATDLGGAAIVRDAEQLLADPLAPRRDRN
jgi:tetratricopeptide (TPR) repeat protein